MTREPPGWVNFDVLFSPEVYLPFYAPFLNESRTRGDADFIERALEPPERGRLLDVGCGTGRIANVLAARGHRLTGIDINTPFLDIANGDAACAGVSVDYQQRDMREIEWEEEFDGAYCYYTTFGYFSDAENADVLRRIARALKPGGRLLIETLNRDGVLHSGAYAQRVVERDGNFQVDQSRYDPLSGRMQTSRTVFLDGRQYSGAFAVRIFTACELVHWLEENGLEYGALYGESGAPYSMNGLRLAVVGRKPLRG